MVSLLLDHGHPEASRYPLGMLWEEAHLVERRISQMMAGGASLMSLAISAGMGGKQSGRALSEAIQKMVK